jgi:hypothetical protein
VTADEGVRRDRLHGGRDITKNVERIGVFVQCPTRRRIDVKELRPLCYLLIVNDDLRLREKSDKAMSETKLLGTPPSVVSAA